MRRFRLIFFVLLVGIVGLYIFEYGMNFSETDLYHGFNLFEKPLQESSSPEVATSTALKIPIFIYHSVRPHIRGESKWEDVYDITSQLLERHLIYLRDHGYTTITLDDLARDIEVGTTSPIAKPVILTFDDGWENEYRYAFPLLKKYHMTAVFYVFTNPIGRKVHFFTWDQIKEMDAAGMTIGAHTLTHPYLQKISEKQLEKEISAGKRILEERLGHPIAHFASPFGYSNAHIETLLKKAGYKTGRTTYKGIFQDDPLRLRGFLASDDFNDFVNALNE